MNLQRTRLAGLLCLLLGLSTLTGCTSVNLEHMLHESTQQTQTLSDEPLTLIQTPEQVATAKARSMAWLQHPLSQEDAVKLALVNSPAWQALLAQHWADGTQIAQTGRLANPHWSLERMQTDDEVEFGRFLSFGLLDILTWPRRQQLANQALQQHQLLLSSRAVEHITQVRHSWVRAVAAQQQLDYAKQVFEAAEASQLLAQRMQRTGNFTSLQRAQQQLFYADAATQWAIAQHAYTAAREQLVRFTGLNPEQAQQLKLPKRLPDLPAAPTPTHEIAANAKTMRLDVQMAQQNLSQQDRSQALQWMNSLTDIELGLRADSIFNTQNHSTHTKQGVELGLRLPLLDSGDLQRTAARAKRLAAAQQLEATVRQAASQLRESYSAYRTAYDVAIHYRDEVVPLRKHIADENLLRYNGMLIGVFELLQDSRDQIGTVMAALRAQEQFWLADAALQASLLGKPIESTLSATSVPATTAKH